MGEHVPYIVQDLREYLRRRSVSSQLRARVSGALRLRLAPDEPDEVFQIVLKGRQCLEGVVKGLEESSLPQCFMRKSLEEIVAYISSDQALKDAFLVIYQRYLAKSLHRPVNEAGVVGPANPLAWKEKWFAGSSPEQIAEHFIVHQVLNQKEAFLGGRYVRSNGEPNGPKAERVEDPPMTLDAYVKFLIDSVCDAVCREVSVTERQTILYALNAVCGDSTLSSAPSEWNSIYYKVLWRTFIGSKNLYLDSPDAKLERGRVENLDHSLLNEGWFQLAFWLAAWITAHRVRRLTLPEAKDFVGANLPEVERLVDDRKPALTEWARANEYPEAAAMCLGRFWCGSYHLLRQWMKDTSAFTSLIAESPISLYDDLRDQNMRDFKNYLGGTRE